MVRSSASSAAAAAAAAAEEALDRTMRAASVRVAFRGGEQLHGRLGRHDARHKRGAGGTAAAGAVAALQRAGGHRSQKGDRAATAPGCEGERCGSGLDGGRHCLVERCGRGSTDARSWCYRAVLVLCESLLGQALCATKENTVNTSGRPSGLCGFSLKFGRLARFLTTKQRILSAPGSGRSWRQLARGASRRVRTPCSWPSTKWLARSMPQHVPGSASQPFWWHGRRVAGACAPWNARAERQ